MNKYQKKLHKEIKELATVCNLSYKRANKTINILKKFELYTPCEDCLNPSCRKKPNKIAYCKDNM